METTENPSLIRVDMKGTGVAQEMRSTWGNPASGSKMRKDILHTGFLSTFLIFCGQHLSEGMLKEAAS